MKIDPESEKALLDIIADGVSSSANSLATASHTSWVTQTLSISANKNGSVANLQTRLAGEKTDQYGAFLSMPGAVFLLMMPKNRAAGLAKAFLSGSNPRPGAPLPREGVCVAEIANIVVNAIANTIADACGTTFLLSAPMMILADKEVLLKKAMDELKNTGETFAIMAYVSMSSEALSSDCTVVVLFSPACRSRIMKALEE